ncbi:MAG: hypothetical protein H0T46_26610 [Deltaproteobacteria bacterium]|nr:hypothetical protein [Deltaproteobacteria bacterium]
MRLLAVTAVLAAVPVAAQPVIRPEPPRVEPCSVTFVRAPDDVRYVIEQWLRAEPRCSGAIELRVVPTEGGYYLMAQRPDGRLHERLVPDAQSAGVLVASWVADDWTGAPQRAPAAPPALAPLPPPSAPLTVIVDPLRVGAPGVAGVLATAPVLRRPHVPGKWMSLGVVIAADNESGGFRADMELTTLGGFKIGGLFDYGEYHADETPGPGWEYGGVALDEMTLAGTLSRTWRYGRWELRGAAALGLTWTDGKAFGTMYSSSASGAWEEYQIEGMIPFAELSALVTRRLFRSWGIAVGPAVTFTQARFATTNPDTKIARETPQLMFFGGLRYEL